MGKYILNFNEFLNENYDIFESETPSSSELEELKYDTKFQKDFEKWLETHDQMQASLKAESDEYLKKYGQVPGLWDLGNKLRRKITKAHNDFWAKYKIDKKDTPAYYTGTIDDVISKVKDREIKNGTIITVDKNFYKQVKEYIKTLQDNDILVPDIETELNNVLNNDKNTINNIKNKIAEEKAKMKTSRKDVSAFARAELNYNIYTAIFNKDAGEILKLLDDAESEIS